jgi:hypothetical protein
VWGRNGGVFIQVGDGEEKQKQQNQNTRPEEFSANFRFNQNKLIGQKNRAQPKIRGSPEVRHRRKEWKKQTVSFAIDGKVLLEDDFQYILNI